MNKTDKLTKVANEESDAIERTLRLRLDELVKMKDRDLRRAAAIGLATELVRFSVLIMVAVIGRSAAIELISGGVNAIVESMKKHEDEQNDLRL